MFSDRSPAVMMSLSRPTGALKFTELAKELSKLFLVSTYLRAIKNPETVVCWNKPDKASNREALEMF